MRFNQTQVRAIEHHMTARFAAELAQHAREFAPRRAQHMGAARLQALSALCLRSAQEHGFTHRGPIRLYLECMLTLGSAFDRDPLLARISETLRPRDADQHTRAERLHRAVAAYLQEVEGPEGAYALAALQRVRSLDLRAPLRSAQLTEAAVALFWSLYPQKLRYAGEPCLRQLFHVAAGEAKALGIRQQASVLELVAVMCSLGVGALEDPAFGWLFARPDGVSGDEYMATVSRAVAPQVEALCLKESA